jgi:hypothetical protein
MRLKFTKALCAVVIFASVPAALANDGFMGLPAGGLTLQQSANIRMLDEDLFISAAEIRVNYEFRNDSGAGIRAVVGFPMPGLPVSVNFDAETDYDIHDVKGLDLLKFETRIEGKPVQSKAVVRAFVHPKDSSWENIDRFRFTDATDITAELAAAGMPLTFDAKLIKTAWTRLPKARKADWIRRGLYIKDGNNEYPDWWLSTIFVREQDFPAGRIVKVQHRYKPFPSGFVMVPDHFKYDPELQKNACVDDPTRRAIGKRLSGHGGGIGTVIDYVLTTAKTWSGPIGHFRLTVDKGKARNIISLCGDNVRKTGPTTFTLEARDFVPDRDVKVLIVSAGD